jgi:hypothetical protein
MISARVMVYGLWVMGYGFSRVQRSVKGTRQDETSQDKTRQDTTRQDKARQDKTRQDKTRQDKTRQNEHFFRNES